MHLGKEFLSASLWKIKYTRNKSFYSNEKLIAQMEYDKQNQNNSITILDKLQKIN